MTEAQISRLSCDWAAIAGEAITLEQIGSGVYAFGSELATLRLFRKFNSSKATQDFSKNMNTFFFRLEI